MMRLMFTTSMTARLRRIHLGAERHQAASHEGLREEWPGGLRRLRCFEAEQEEAKTREDTKIKALEGELAPCLMCQVLI